MGSSGQGWERLIWALIPAGTVAGTGMGMGTVIGMGTETEMCQLAHLSRVELLKAKDRRDKHTISSVTCGGALVPRCEDPQCVTHVGNYLAAGKSFWLI